MFELVRKDRDIIRDDDLLTPIEISARILASPEKAAQYALFRRLRTQPPKAYERRPVSQSASLYTSSRQADALVVGFCGKAFRLMVPASVFLQAMDDRKFDVLILKDVEHLHFERGIEGFGDSLETLARQISTIARRQSYQSLITFGTSMGGLPALRVGRMLSADRAISIGGRFVWHVARLLSASRGVVAFDPLCGCVPSAESSINIYSQHSPDDVIHAQRLTVMTPDVRNIALPVPTHNAVMPYHEADALDALLAMLFDSAVEPSRDALAALLSQSQHDSGAHAGDAGGVRGVHR